MKHFDDDHLALLTNGARLQGPAGELFAAVAIIPFDVAMRFGRRHVEELATAGKLLLSVAISEESVMANALGPFRENVE